jgi:hypothetical protein
VRRRCGVDDVRMSGRRWVSGTRWLTVGADEVDAGRPWVRVSPDGRQLAYRWPRGDVPLLWVVDGVEWSGWAVEAEVADWVRLTVEVP